MKTCQLMVGYKDKNDSFLDSEGYFHTGDLGYYDKDGVIHFIEKVSFISILGRLIICSQVS